MQTVKSHLHSVLCLGTSLFLLAADRAVSAEVSDDVITERYVAAQATSTNDVQTEVPLEDPVAVEDELVYGIQPQERLMGRRKPHQEVAFKLGGDLELRQNQSAEWVVVIGGTAKVAGDVTDSVVVIGGNADVSGKVRDQVVSVFGSVKAGEGARIGGDVVSFGGTIDAEGADIRGTRYPIDFGLGEQQLESLKTWFYQCVVKMRPLAPQVGWVWWVAGVFLLLYLLIAVLFPHPVSSCVAELRRRPAVTFLISVLSLLLMPLILAMLAATGFGLIVIPFVLAALILGGIVGKVAVLEWIGLRLVETVNSSFARRLENRGTGGVIGLLLGALVVALLYMIPFLGLVLFLILGSWGLGSAIVATCAGLRREMPPKAQDPSPVWASSTIENPSVGGAGQVGSPPMVAEYEMPKATFWERAGAGIIDLILVGILNGIVGGPPLGFLLALAYFAAMWAWKGTTVGGIIFKLRVMRADGKPVSFAVALVRALSGAFSLCALFVGFLWIAWDRDRQGWHDKLAGTWVLRQPRSTPLI